MKKKLLTLSTMVVGVAPIVTAIACSKKSSSEDMSKVVTINISDEKWRAAYEAVIKDFKTEKKAELDKKGIKDIRIIKTSVDLGTLSKKGIRDEESVTDIFIYAGNEISKFIEKEALTPFTQNTAETYLDEHTTGEDFVTGAEGSIDNGKLYGVPQNIEAMVAIHRGNDKKETTGKTSEDKVQVTNFSNLWMAGGFFNTSKTGTAYNAHNLAKIVKTDTSQRGKIVFGDITTSGQETKESQWKKFIKEGFTKIVDNVISLNVIGAGNSDDDSVFNPNSFLANGAKAAPHVQNFYKVNKKETSILDGPWAVSGIQKVLGDATEDKLSASAPKNWNQWGGGWMFGLNSRMKESEKEIAEMLIPYFYKKKHAKTIYENAGKLLPTEKAKEYFKGSDPSDSYTSISEIPKAIYATWEAGIYEKSNDAAFNDVWSAYASAVEASKDELAIVKTAGKSALITKLTNDFMTNLKAVMKKVNDAL